MQNIVTPAIAKFGSAMQRHRKIIQIIQWSVVGIYIVLLVIPAFMSLPPRGAQILNNMVLFAQFVFWGIWWPFVILSVVLMGRLWCGVFCPEGALTEWTSKNHGRNKTIPRFIKWRGWPAVAFVLTTLYGQLISVYDYAEAALLILGGSTAAAMVIGYFYGRGTRVWCRYLCPVSGVFNLLSRLAPISFKTDLEKWKNYQGSKPQNPNCPPMINIHQLSGVSGCHMCGRCADFRDAVSLQPRSCSEEIVKWGGQKQNNIWETRLLLFGMIGVAIGAFTWTVSPWFIHFKQFLAALLVEHNIFWPLNPTAPWWILTNYPANNDSFNWLDGFCITVYILGSGIFFWLLLSVILRLISILLQQPAIFKHLAQAFVPLAAAGLFLGLTATTIKLLQFDGIHLWWISELRGLILFGAGLWSIYLATQIIIKTHNGLLRRTISFAFFTLSTLPILYAWWLMFWGW